MEKKCRVLSKVNTMVSTYIKRNSFFGFIIGFISACLVLSGLPTLKKLAYLPGFADNTKSVRLVCWIMTMPANHQKKAIHVKATWGSRCDVLLFMSTEEGKKLNNSLVNLYLLIFYGLFHVSQTKIFLQ